MFDNTVELGWAQMSARGLSQWGPAVTRDFLEASLSPHLVKHLASALADRDNEFTARRLFGLMKVARS